MYIKRQIEAKIKKNLFKGQIITILGARRVGKTTLVKKIVHEVPGVSSKYINCDEADYRRLLDEADTSTKLKEIVGNFRLIIVDEAQRIKNIGLKLKLLVDTFPDQQVIATGSSSFELGQETSEPLTGRTIDFWLYPFSLKELNQIKDKVEINRQLETLLIFGSYPSVVLASSLEEKKVVINSISEKYLYKDVLKFQSIKGGETVRKLLEALALQIGNEVSYNELANLVGVSKQTIANYVDILEKAFVVFKLRPFSRNLRKELGKLRKIYFYDLGVRNSLINNQNPLSLRNDIGQLWENFVIGERRKRENYIGRKTNLYFWRTYDRQEIDLVEERGGKLLGCEIKWGKSRGKAPKAWREGYPEASWELINQKNYFEFLGGDGEK